VDDERGQARARDPEERGREAVERDDHDHRGEYARERRAHARLGLDRGARERARGRVRVEDSSNRVRHADRDQFLVRVDLVAIHPAESCRGRSEAVSATELEGHTLRDGDVFEEQDDRRDRELPTKRRDELSVRCEQPDVLEAGRDLVQDLNRVLALLVLAVTRVEP
jgi:hypothetical protein